MRRENRIYGKTLLVLALPLLLQNVLDSGVDLVDSLMVGALGANAINAVNFANTLFFLHYVVVFGICSGAAIFIGQYWGKEDVNAIHRVMGICGIASVAVSLFFVVVSLAIPEVFLGLFTSHPEVIELGKQYARGVAPTYLLMAISLTLTISLHCMGQMKLPIFTTVVTLLLNVSLNYLFLFVLEWGVLGAALATTVSRMVELLLLLVLTIYLRLPLITRLKHYFLFDRVLVKQVFQTATPVMLNETIWALGIVVYMTAFKGAGNEAQAAANIATPIFDLFNIVGMGLGVACGIMIANLLGDNQIALAKRYARKSLIVSVGVGLILGVVMVAVSPLIFRLYEVSDSIRETAWRIILVYGIYLVFETVNFTTIVGILRNGGDTLYCMIIDAGAVWVIGVPAAFLGVYLLELPIYFVIAFIQLEEFAKFFLSVRRVRSNVWAKRLVG